MYKDYFQLFNLQKKYTVNQTQLKAHYLLMQVQCHPDKASDELQKQEFIEQSATLHVAKNVLQDDYLRAEYMLKLAGVKFDDCTLRRGMSYKDLEQIMETNYIIEETNNLTDLYTIEHRQLEEKHILLQEISSAFNKNNIIKALDLTIKLKYLTNLIGIIKSKIKHANSKNI